jgi:chromosome segregation ATPase
MKVLLQKAFNWTKKFWYLIIIAILLAGVIYEKVNFDSLTRTLDDARANYGADLQRYTDDKARTDATIGQLEATIAGNNKLLADSQTVISSQRQSIAGLTETGRRLSIQVAGLTENNRQLAGTIDSITGNQHTASGAVESAIASATDALNSVQSLEDRISNP